MHTNKPKLQQVLITEFAPGARAPMEIVTAQYQTFVGTHCKAFFDALPTMILALNLQRQMIFANLAAVAFFGHDDVCEVLGLRPGEAMGCVNAQDAPAGCGTSRHCRRCGMIQAILAAVDGAVGEHDCSLLRRDNSVLEGMDLHAHASPLTIEGQKFVIFAITDISNETRRRSMERIFFHDVLNLAGGINGLVEVLSETRAEDMDNELSVLHSATRTLVDEILAQRELVAAESNDLTPNYALISPRAILEQLQGLYSRTPVAQGQVIALECNCGQLRIETDERLTQRVVGNMLKNALEAGRPGDTVVLACSEDGDHIRLTVNNQAEMPEDVQENIFRRRFSTKGPSRGMGTYSMLLLSERYLGGEVSFISSGDGGTTFTLRLPKRLEKA
jgi:signal transduction histidine kinase